MKHYICIDIEHGATPFGIGHSCPTPDCQGFVSLMDMLKWSFRCTRGCHGSMPLKIASVHVDVEYLSKPREADADAG